VNAPPALRAGRDDDAAGFIALIEACWAEYPGCVFDLDGEVPELRALATHFAELGGALWVAERDGALVGMVAVTPHDATSWEIKRMYVAKQHRGAGLAQLLLDAAEAHAVARGAAETVLWSDTRFDRAHRFYEKQAYVRTGAILALGDKSNSIDFGFVKPLRGVMVRRLNAAGSASARAGLAAILRDCVAEGAAAGFGANAARAEHDAYWARIASDVAQGKRVLLAAWCAGEMVGTVQLDLAMPPDQLHRAALEMLLVAPRARRRGVARALMAAADAAAIAAGRSLLTLDTREGDVAATMFRALGWRQAGRIPGFAMDGAGATRARLFFYRQLDGIAAEAA
jgi:GNAT superfamily N-acetyltransferase